jgi:hypothetical protein
MKTRILIIIFVITISGCKKNSENDLFGLWEITFEELCFERKTSRIRFSDNSIAYINHYFEDGTSYWDEDNPCTMEWWIEKDINYRDISLHLNYSNYCEYMDSGGVSIEISAEYYIEHYHKDSIIIILKKNSIGDIFCSRFRLPPGWAGTVYKSRTLKRISH